MSRQNSPRRVAPSRGPAEGTRAMAIVSSIAALRAVIVDWRRAGERIGFVATMGALHEGHLALLAAARRDCDRVVASIFVNPSQFNSADDLESYPRDEARDTALLRADGCDLLFLPSVAEVYPAGFATTVQVAGLSDCLCGRTRPGHLTGVATVVAKLFLQVLPDAAYFGEKDYQQLLVVRRMAADLNMPLEVIGVETVRESDGLALSSRNRNLSPAERAVAPRLQRIMQDLAARLARGEPVVPALDEGRKRLLAAGFAAVDYLELRGAENLEALDRVQGPCRLFAAAWLGETRLIDNLKVR